MTVIDKNPLVSIGLPVYNGENYLREAMQSLLGQTYKNIELVICDNASTDSSGEICEEFAKMDNRIRYERLSENIGGTPNHNRVIESSRGDYFMWGAHDDIWEEEYIEKCLKAFGENPDAVVAYTWTGIIDGEGKWMETGNRDWETGNKEWAIPMKKAGPHLGDARPWKRFAQIHDLYTPLYPVYGLVKMDALRKVGYMPIIPAGDKILFARLALRGRIIEVPEIHYFRRMHDLRSITAYPNMRDRYKWAKSSSSRKIILPHIEYFFLMMSVILHSHVSLIQKMMCTAVMLRWIKRRRKKILSDFRF